MKQKTIEDLIKEKLDEINDLTLTLGIKFDNELKELHHKLKNEKDIYKKAYYRTLIKYTDSEIDKFDKMIFEIIDLDFETRIINVIEELLENKYIFIDEWSTLFSDWGEKGKYIYKKEYRHYMTQMFKWKQIDLTGTTIIKALIKGKRLLCLLDDDPYLKKNTKKNEAQKIDALIEVLKKAQEQTKNCVTSKLLEDEINEIKELNLINENKIYKIVFYYIYMAFKVHSKKEFKIDDLVLQINNILKEAYSLSKSPNFKVSNKMKQINYQNFKFSYFDN